MNVKCFWRLTSNRPSGRAAAAGRASQLAPRFDYRALFSRLLSARLLHFFELVSLRSVRTLHSACKVRHVSVKIAELAGMSIFLGIPQTQVLTKKINKKMIQGGSLYPTSWVHQGVNLARSLLSRSLRAMNSFNSTGSTRGDAVARDAR